ncbi:HNH endonuclease [Corallococcus sp. 4LFB]|uniref:HNH endonuclease n=1 Tax=Corallococcus sp. 4LFB TaxID=3383249 RepID=UPI003974D3BF
MVDLFAGGGAELEMAVGRPVTVADRERFARQVTWVDGDGCWMWSGGRHRLADGTLTYGGFCFGKRRFLAHRVAVLLAGRQVLASEVVRHTCDTPGCVRPSHLVVGTQAENLADMRQKKRAYFNAFPAGAAHPNAKMTTEKAASIRSDRAAGMSFAKLGKKYGLHPSTAHDICAGKTWKGAA